MYDFTRNRLHYIKGGRYPHCHCLFIDDRTRALVDPACDADVVQRIDAERAVDVIVNSHCHEDHFLNNYLLPKAQLWAHEKEAPMFRDMESLMDAWLTPAEKEGPMGDELRKFLLAELHYVPREPDRFLADGEIVTFGETRMQTLHTPGHSPGHLCFFFPDEKVLFTADLDLVKAGPYYGDKGSSIEDTIDSLERIMAIDADIYLSAHGKQGVYDGDPEIVRRYLDVIYQRENRLLEELDEKPMTLDEIAALGVIYGKRDGSDIWFIAASERKMMEKHLARLQTQGRVQPDGDRFVVC